MPTIPPANQGESMNPPGPVKPPEKKSRVGCWMVVTIIGLLGLFVAWRAWGVVSMILDLHATATRLNQASGQNRARSLPVPLLDGLGRAPGVTRDPFESANLDWSDTWPPAGRRLPQNIMEGAVASAIRDLTDFEARLTARIDAGLASPPSTPITRFPYTFGPPPDLRGARETARLWLAVSRIQAARGDRAQAMRTLLGVVLAANALEATEPDGCRLQTFLAGMALRNLAAIGLSELAADGGVGRTEAMTALTTIIELDRLAVTLGTVLALERDIPLSIGVLLQESIDSGKAMAEYRRNPTTLARLLRPAYAGPRLEEAWSLTDQIASLPYRQAQPMLDAFARKNDARQQRVGTPGLHYLSIITDQDNCFFEILLVTLMPDLQTAVDQSAQAKVKLRGAILALLAIAYQQERHQWPTSLDDLQDFAGGTTLPVDLFANGPFTYGITTGHPHLSSVGRDGRAGTADDLVFLPIRATAPGAPKGDPSLH